MQLTVSRIVRCGNIKKSSGFPDDTVASNYLCPLTLLELEFNIAAKVYLIGSLFSMFRVARVQCLHIHFLLLFLKLNTQ